MKPRLLDLFCCEGGSAVGYHRAGFDVVGVDLLPRFAKRYPFKFVQADALAVLRGEVLMLDQFDAIHASPPCQGYTRGNAGKVTTWPKLIGPVRDLLAATGLPYVIENVKDARPHMIEPVGLCGCMFDLATTDTDGLMIHLRRLRLFETNWPMSTPGECSHYGHDWIAGAYGGGRRDKYEAKYVRKGGYVPRDKDVVKRLLGIAHGMTWGGLFESVPPAYTEWIGHQLRVTLTAQDAA